jgi:AAA+ superfamily predicted ATPase
MTHTLTYHSRLEGGRPSCVASFGTPGRGESVPSSEVYFEYASIVQRIIEMLKERYGCEFSLYFQEDSNDAWSELEEDIRESDPELEHVASIFDLVESRSFSYSPSAEGIRVNIGPSIRNNVFGYPRFKVAMARIPFLMANGIGWEDLIFAESDEGLRRMLHDRQERRLRQRKITLFTDTRNGLDQARESLVREVARNGVVLEEKLKTEIYRSIDEFFSGDRTFYRSYNIPYKRGILLYGSPGNGKTTLVKAIVSSIRAPVAYWQITQYTNSESILEVFEAAMRTAPAVLVIEDIDSMPESCRSYFLNTLDGATSKEGLFLIGTTNYPEKIDPALMNRAGRFDRAYEVKKPGEALRLSYLKLKGMLKLADEAEVAYMAERTAGFSLAQLNELYVSAALQMHYDHELKVDLLIEELKADINKDRTGAWMSDSGGKGKLGFFHE